MEEPGRAERGRRDGYLGVAGQGVTGLLAAAGYQPDWPAQMQAQVVGLAALSLFGFFVAWLLLAPLAILGHLLRPHPAATSAVERQPDPIPLRSGSAEESPLKPIRRGRHCRCRAARTSPRAARIDGATARAESSPDPLRLSRQRQSRRMADHACQRTGFGDFACPFADLLCRSHLCQRRTDQRPVQRAGRPRPAPDQVDRGHPLHADLLNHRLLHHLSDGGLRGRAGTPATRPSVGGAEKPRSSVGQPSGQRAVRAPPEAGPAFGPCPAPPPRRRVAAAC